MRTTTRRGANHALHLTLSVLTCGIWAVTGWPIAAAMGRKTTVTRDTQPFHVAPPQYPQPAPYLPPCGYCTGTGADPDNPGDWVPAVHAYDPGSRGPCPKCHGHGRARR